MRCLLAFVVALLLATPLYAQPLSNQHAEADNLKVPAAWEVRLDRPKADVVIGDDAEASDIYFVNMTPGWHVTTGPAAIFYHPEAMASGTYRLETLIHLFDPKGRNEAFGVFMGGTGLDGDDQAYDYFLIRNNGQYLLKRRTGSGTSTLQGWTASDAIQTYGSDSGASVPNTLAVEVGAEEVTFSINGTEVARVPKADVRTDGVVGLRVNHALNLHIESFVLK